MMHVKGLGMAALVAGGLLGSLGLASTAQAAPIGLGAAGTLAPETDVTRVAGGCGPGFVPNRFGYCRPFYGPGLSTGRGRSTARATAITARGRTGGGRMAARAASITAIDPVRMTA